MHAKNIIPGYYLGKEFPTLNSSYLVSVTEQTTLNDLEELKEAFIDFFNKQGGN